MKDTDLEHYNVLKMQHSAKTIKRAHITKSKTHKGSIKAS